VEPLLTWVGGQGESCSHWTNFNCPSALKYDNIKGGGRAKGKRPEKRNRNKGLKKVKTIWGAVNGQRKDGI